MHQPFIARIWKSFINFISNTWNEQAKERRQALYQYLISIPDHEQILVIAVTTTDVKPLLLILRWLSSCRRDWRLSSRCSLHHFQSLNPPSLYRRPAGNTKAWTERRSDDRHQSNYLSSQIIEYPRPGGHTVTPYQPSTDSSVSINRFDRDSKDKRHK